MVGQTDVETDYTFSPGQMTALRATSITQAVLYLLLFLAGLFNLYAYMCRLEKYRDIPMFLFYFNAQITLFLEVVGTSIDPDFDFDKGSFVLSSMVYYSSLAMGICYCMVIFELWMRMKYAMMEMHQIKHKIKFIRSIKVLNVVTVLTNLLIYSACYWFTKCVWQLTQDPSNESQTSLHYELRRQARFISSVELILTFFSVVCVILIIKMLRTAFGTFFRVEMRRLTLLSVMFLFSFLFRSVFDIFFSVDLDQDPNLFKSYMVDMIVEFIWIFFPILVIYYQHINGYLTAKRLAKMPKDVPRMVSQPHTNNRQDTSATGGQLVVSSSFYKDYSVGSSLLDQSIKSGSLVHGSSFDEFNKQLMVERDRNATIVLGTSKDNSNLPQVIISHNPNYQSNNNLATVFGQIYIDKEFDEHQKATDASVINDNENPFDPEQEQQYNRLTIEPINTLKQDSTQNNDVVTVSLYHESTNHYSLNSSDYQKFTKENDRSQTEPKKQSKQ